jgi:hypothetical protein
MNTAHYFLVISILIFLSFINSLPTVQNNFNVATSETTTASKTTTTSAANVIYTFPNFGPMLVLTPPPRTRTLKQRRPTKVFKIYDYFLNEQD